MRCPILYIVIMASSDTFTYSFINFDEPEPLSNRKSTILAVVITFMVREQQQQQHSLHPAIARQCHSNPIFAVFLLDLCGKSTMGSVQDYPGPRLG